MRNILLQQCQEYFKSDEFKQEFKKSLKPIVNYLLEEIYIYLLYFILFLLLSFLLHLGVFIINIRFNMKINKILKALK